MPTWDLPEPQGPMIPTLINASSPAMPRHGLHIVLPTHYRLTGTDDLLRRIREQQVTIAKEQKIDASAAGLPHYEAYAQMLEVHLFELTILSRYGQPRRPRGLMLALEEAIADALGLSVNQVQKLRKGIAACQKGDRSKVKWLKIAR
jgi:hypothetical protein